MQIKNAEKRLTMKKVISLNGQWDFVADLDPKYHNDTAIQGTIPNSRPNISRRHWKKVQVPGVWQKYAERYDIYEGVCWFVRTFELEPGSGYTSAKLRFGAVNYLCRVFPCNTTPADRAWSRCGRSPAPARAARPRPRMTRWRPNCWPIRRSAPST